MGLIIDRIALSEGARGTCAARAGLPTHGNLPPFDLEQPCALSRCFEAPSSPTQRPRGVHVASATRPFGEAARGSSERVGSGRVRRSMPTQLGDDVLALPTVSARPRGLRPPPAGGCLMLRGKLRPLSARRCRGSIP